MGGLNEEFGLGWNDYENRWYDPAIGRFTGVDPIADKFTPLSTYNYASNNPSSGIDLHGLQFVPLQIAWDLAKAKVGSIFGNSSQNNVIQKGVESIGLDQETLFYGSSSPEHANSISDNRAALAMVH